MRSMDNATSLNQRIYEQIRKDILTFNLKPGESVSAAKLADRYLVSRTPVREALVRLAGESMIQIYPKSKSVISRIDMKAAKQEWFIRRTLELGMVDVFFDNLSEKDIDCMAGFCEKQVHAISVERTPESSYEYLSADNDFHQVTYRVAGQNMAAGMIASMVAHYDRARLLIDLESVNQERTVSDHRKLVELAEKGDRDGYRECLSRHLGYLAEDIEQIKQKKPEYFE